jgi:hypothetical protein
MTPDPARDVSPLEAINIVMTELANLADQQGQTVLAGRVREAQRAFVGCVAEDRPKRKRTAFDESEENR